ncbi:MAG: thiamine diphosphokinase [Pseudomonadota bacterium]
MQKTHNAFWGHVDLQRYRSILALNGELPSKSFFDIKLPVIAADGATNRLHGIGVKPKVIVGDLDAVYPSLLEQTESVYVLDQNRCDFEKALEYAKQSRLLPAIIVGVSGGYIDHILNNMSIFIAEGEIFYAPPIAGHALKAGSRTTFFLPVNTKISLIGATETVVSTNGLKWELDRSRLFFVGGNSCFNRTIETEVLVEVHDGSCLVMIYLEEIHDSGSGEE